MSESSGKSYLVMKIDLDIRKLDWSHVDRRVSSDMGVSDLNATSENSEGPGQYPESSFRRKTDQMTWELYLVPDHRLNSRKTSTATSSLKLGISMNS
jgi:hypothetical protein